MLLTCNDGHLREFYDQLAPHRQEPVALAALLGAGRALSSGPAEAWYVDTVHAKAGPGAELRTGLARGSSATSAALTTGTLLGGALPWLLGLAPTSAPD